jgi:chemotaxis protein histidine kinase CheA
MDDLRELLTETNQSLDTVDNQLVRFEQDPNNAKILDNIFRLVHTIKGTCGFLGLPRLEALAHAARAIETEAQFCSRPQPTLTVCHRRTNGGPLTGGPPSLVDQRIPPA